MYFFLLLLTVKLNPPDTDIQAPLVTSQPAVAVISNGMYNIHH